MGFLSCCKDCSCWCIFTISTVILLISTGLALSDIAAMTQTQEVIDIVLNSPVPQLRCLEVCRTWYSEESGQSCCDRYNSNLCLEKASCTADYISSSKVEISILMNDAQSQTITAGLCLITMCVIALFQFNQHKLENKLQKSLDDKPQTKLCPTQTNLSRPRVKETQQTIQSSQIQRMQCQSVSPHLFLTIM